MVAELVATLLFAELVGFGLNFLVWSKGFYTLPHLPSASAKKSRLRVCHLHCLASCSSSPFLPLH